MLKKSRKCGAYSHSYTDPTEFNGVMSSCSVAAYLSVRAYVRYEKSLATNGCT